MSCKLHWSGKSIQYTTEDIATVIRVMLEADPLTQGKHQKDFESVFSEYHGGRPSFAVSSGAAALELSAILLDLQPGDEVIIPAHTYCATAIPFARRKAKIVWADIHPGFRVVMSEQIEPLITPKTRAIVVVHLYGVNAPMGCIMQLAHKHNLIVIEDCAQSLGASYEYKKEWLGTSVVPWGRSGTHGDISIYSFHGQKNITTLGEGGMITIHDPNLASKIPGLRHNGHREYPSNKKVDFDMFPAWPYNFSIGEAQCALGTLLMKRLDDLNATRFRKARWIIDQLKDIDDLKFQTIPKGSTHVYHLLCARYQNRDVLMERLKQCGIECVTQYLPLYRQPLFREFKEHDCPNTDDFYDHALSFPFQVWYSDEQISYLTESIRGAITKWSTENSAGFAKARTLCRF